MATGTRELFGIAVTSAYLRMLVMNLRYKVQGLCEGFAVGFGLASTEGDSLYYYFQKSEQLTSTIGFNDTSYYAQFELSIANIINQFLPNEPVINKQILTITAHSIIYSYALNSSLEIEDVVKLIGKTLSSVAQKTFGYSPFQSDKNGTIIHPFESHIVSLLIQQDYHKVTKDIATNEKVSEVPLVNYNWYDVSNVMAGPDLQIMKDVENQYYYISGHLIYGIDGENLPTCIEDEILIKTPTGEVTSRYIRNTPCIQSDSYVGPPTKVNFFRKFNDGPGSSGIWSTDVKNAYIAMDKTVLSDRDWRSNRINLFSFHTGSNSGYKPLGQTYIDTQGRYSLPEEYSFASDINLCSGYPRMHIGDNLPKMQKEGYIDGFGYFHCTGYSLVDRTGFKFVDLELDASEWTIVPRYFKGNPDTSTGNYLARALNIDPNPYLATAETQEDGSVVLKPYYYNENAGLTQWYVGPPQLNGTSTMPSLAFFQTFDNPTFGDTISLCLYPSLSVAGGISTGDESVRNHTIATKPVFSGKRSSHVGWQHPQEEKIQFVSTISSNLSGYDEVYHQFFGMGDALGGQYDLSAFEASNAGFRYTGYNVVQSGQKINIKDSLAHYNNFILGSPVKNFQYIEGFTDYVNQFYPVSKMIGHDGSGNRFWYYHFDKRKIGNIFNDSVEWNWFAPIPEELDTTMTRRYKSQQVENYFPRYSHGPFAIETRQFLYPNAASLDSFYQYKRHGFPAQITFDLEVREEAVKEIYCTYLISTDNSIGGQRFIRVQRPGTDPTDSPIMHRMFIPDFEESRNKYDFNLWKTGSDFSYIGQLQVVDNDYAPFDYLTNSIPSGKNGRQYNHGNYADDIFKCGVLLTGDQTTLHRWYTGEGTGSALGNDYYFIYSEAPNSVGTYHFFKTFSQNVTLRYTPPIFNIQHNALIASSELLETFPMTNLYDSGAFIFKNDGSLDAISSGRDPFFWEYVGGRLGGPSVKQEGGYHSKGIIGDQWLGLAKKTYGNAIYSCDGHNYISFRRPDLDDSVYMFIGSPTGTKVFARGLSFSPFVFGKTNSPYTSSSSIKYVWNNTTGILPTTFRSGALDFNLSNFFPMKSGSGWYNASGLILGPFDRDVEFGVYHPNRIIAESMLFINGYQLTNLQYGEGFCPWDAVRGIGRNTGIILNEEGRNGGYTIMARIPSGKQAIINVNSQRSEYWEYDVYREPTGIGLETGAIVTIKPWQALYQSKFDNSIHLGEQGWKDPYIYENNGLEHEFFFSHGPDFTELESNQTKIVYTRSGYYYPTPGDDFAVLGTRDKAGNLIYPLHATVENYWKHKAQVLQHSIPISGWREGSRYSITIKNVKINYDYIPYQNYLLVVPSGYCTISGEMGYLAQAENGVFTEGIHLVNMTPNDEIASLYDPQFVSDVLTRVPWFQTPISSSVSPVLSAPSVMKQRRFISGINENQSYIGVLSQAPYNYNKLLWPALSDIEILNPGETMEAVPPDDGTTFTSSTPMFSAAQGQILPNGGKNPNDIKRYGIRDQYQLYDSISTDAILNSGKCLTSKKGRQTFLSQDNMSGALAPLGTTLSIIQAGLI